MTTKEMQDRLGRSPQAMKKLQMVLLDGVLYHPHGVEDWEPYPEQEACPERLG